MSWSYYTSGDFLYVATTNLFNAIAFLSAILLLLDPLVFAFHTVYGYYRAQKALKEQDGKKFKKAPALNKPVWWKWYALSATIHLLDAWFFRSIIPFFERARTHKDQAPNDLQDLADISRLLWGIIRSLSLFVITLEIWEKRLVLKTVLGQHWTNPKWGFAVSYFVAPSVIALSALPVAVYFILLGVWNSTGFFWMVIKDAFSPDWRHGQDVFVLTVTEKVIQVHETAKAKPVWKVW